MAGFVAGPPKPWEVVSLAASRRRLAVPSSGAGSPVSERESGRPTPRRSRCQPSGPSPAEGGCAGTRVVVDAVERHIEQAVVARLKSPQGIADERFNEPFTAGPRRHSPR